MSRSSSNLKEKKNKQKLQRDKDDEETKSDSKTSPDLATALKRSRCCRHALDLLGMASKAISTSPAKDVVEEVKLLRQRGQRGRAQTQLERQQERGQDSKNTVNNIEVSMCGSDSDPLELHNLVSQTIIREKRDV
jgi:methylmalonyl-CoA mutase N-terminal domain/subunit